MYLLIKRCLDVFFALLLLIVLSPVILLSSLAILMVMGRPIIFTQPRIGYKNKIFMVYKFRTMTMDTDATGNLLPDYDRLPRLGHFLRSYSLDELPQLFNILTGCMSFIGPRPLLVEYGPLYNDQQRKRHDVIPGISGWAQVNGRNSVSWHQKFELDLFYVKNQSFWLDMKIFFLTIHAILAKKDINQNRIETMPKFDGTN
jgi:lipopolysaccharide/colanic/teichoic acid biosynthesis glycosyltransferase